MATQLDQLLGYGRDFAQGASNSAASTVSAPVDGIAWLLKKAGLDVGEPVGGSDWMARKGLTAQPKNALAGLLGESAGMVAPIMAAAKGPQIANALNQMVENAAARPTLNPQTGAIVWHGTPHKFDKFDSSKIGTGEGAQAYGHGLYLAEAPDVARTYSADRSYVGAHMRGQPQAINYDDPAWLAQKTIDELGDPAKAKAHLEMVQRTAAKHMSKESAAGVSGAIDLIASGGVAPKGNLYKVDLPDDKIARMLDWDKPLSQQAPKVRAAIAKTRKMLPPNAVEDLGGDLSLMYGPDVMPKDFLNTWESFGQKAGGEAALRGLGVPGVRYLDGGSRAAGAGTRNYVVFPGEENALRILERNGKTVP